MIDNATFLIAFPIPSSQIWTRCPSISRRELIPYLLSPSSPTESVAGRQFFTYSAQMLRLPSQPADTPQKGEKGGSLCTFYTDLISAVLCVSGFSQLNHARTHVSVCRLSSEHLALRSLGHRGRGESNPRLNDEEMEGP